MLSSRTPKDQTRGRREQGKPISVRWWSLTEAPVKLGNTRPSNESKTVWRTTCSVTSRCLIKGGGQTYCGGTFPALGARFTFWNWTVYVRQWFVDWWPTAQTFSCLPTSNQSQSVPHRWKDEQGIQCLVYTFDFGNFTWVNCRSWNVQPRWSCAAIA